jgi:hypothetical protein
MHELRVRGSRSKPKPPAPGLNVHRTKKGTLGLKRSKGRAFPYVTFNEIAGIAKQLEMNQSDIWNLFKQKAYIVAKDRLEAEGMYAKLVAQISTKGTTDGKVKRMRRNGRRTAKDCIETTGEAAPSAEEHAQPKN